MRFPRAFVRRSPSRSSHEERGLKFLVNDKLRCSSVVAPLTRSVDWNCHGTMTLCCFLQSLLSRGAWIEIAQFQHPNLKQPCRSSHEERGLKFFVYRIHTSSSRRSSHEERGLKSNQKRKENPYTVSLLSRGAWIEISNKYYYDSDYVVAPLTRSVDWNYEKFPNAPKVSLLSRGAWIEIARGDFGKVWF